jgi:hypothetical protein
MGVADVLEGAREAGRSGRRIALALGPLSSELIDAATSSMWPSSSVAMLEIRS